MPVSTPSTSWSPPTSRDPTGTYGSSSTSPGSRCPAASASGSSSVVSNPTVVGRCQCDLMSTGIAVSDHHLFLADEKGLKAFDVSKIDHPILEGEYPLEAPMKRIRVSGDFIFVCASRAFVILEMKFLSGK